VRYTLELTAPEGHEFGPEFVRAASELASIEVRFNKSSVHLWGNTLAGKVTGAGMSPRDRSLRITVECDPCD
jgi:hypothetical protein